MVPLVGPSVKQVKFYLEDEYYQVLKQKAEEQGVSVSSLVREIVLKELELLEENSLDKRISELENELKEVNEKLQKISEILKRHKSLINDLYNCCSQVNLTWAYERKLRNRKL